MNILMISDFYPPFMGGMYRHVQLLSRGLVKRGHKVTVCTVGNKYLNGFEEDRGVKVIRFEGFFQRIPFLFEDTKRKRPPPMRDFLITKKLEKIIKKERPDVLHAHGWILYSAVSMREKWKIPLVTTLHDYGFICPKVILLKENRICETPFTRKCVICTKDWYGPVKSLGAYCGVKLNRKRLKCVDKFIAVSKYVKEIYSRLLDLNNKDIIVIPNFYDRKLNKDVVETKILPKDFVLYVGALYPGKGGDVLIEAYRRLNTKSKLVIIGITHPKYDYKAEENVVILKNAPSEIVMEALLKCRFGIIPSIYPDPCPTVAFEEMSCQKAIIASDIGGLAEIIENGKTGILVPPNNCKELAKAMGYLMRNPDVAIRMGEEGYRRFLSNYTVEVNLPKIEKLYESL